MLVLSRKRLEQILIGRDIRITVVKLERNQVRLGIEAPPGISILRSELIASEEFAADHDERANATSPACSSLRLASRGQSDGQRRSSIEF